MTNTHQRRAVEWWCYLHSPDPRQPRHFIEGAESTATPDLEQQDTELFLYDSTASAEEGLWARKGWAGRST